MARTLILCASGAVSTSAFADQVPVVWVGGKSGNWSDVLNWSPEVVPNNVGGKTYAVTLGNGRPDASVTLDLVAAIDSLAVDSGDQLTLLNNFDLIIAAGLVVNNGQIRLASAGGLTDLQILQDTLLTGSGEFVMLRNVNNRVYGSPTTRLTCDAEQTIRGGGNFGANLMKFTNLGLVRAESLLFPLILDFSGADNFNAGVFEANNGTLQINGTTMDNTGGQIRAGLDGLVWIGGGSVITGGELTTKENGLVRLTGPTTLTNVALTGELTVNNDIDPILIGGFTNDGLMSLASTGSNTDLRISGDLTIGGAGEIQLNNNKNNRLFAIVSSQRLTNGANHTIRGAGQVGANFMALTNQGSIIADLPAGMTIDPSSQGFDNQGFLAVADQIAMTIGAGPFTTTGEVEVGPRGTLTRSGDFLQNGGTVNVRGQLTVNVGSYVVSDGVVTGDGVITADIANLAGTVNPGPDAGVLTIDGDYTQASSGLIQFEALGSREGEYDQLHIQGTATLSGGFAMVAGGSYKPQIGDEFTLITADKIEGEFDCAQFLGVSKSNGVLFIYEPTQVRLKVLVVPPTDFTDDGVVDGADLGIMLANYGPCGEECCPFDLNGTGTVDSGDLGYLLSLWGTDGIVEKGEPF